MRLNGLNAVEDWLLNTFRILFWLTLRRECQLDFTDESDLSDTATNEHFVAIKHYQNACVQQNHEIAEIHQSEINDLYFTVAGSTLYSQFFENIHSDDVVTEFLLIDDEGNVVCRLAQEAHDCLGGLCV